MCIVPTSRLHLVITQLKPTCHVMKEDGCNWVHRWTICDFRVSISKHTHYSVSNNSTFPGQMVSNTVPTLHKLWQENRFVRKFCNIITNNLLQDNSAFSCNLQVTFYTLNSSSSPLQTQQNESPLTFINLSCAGNACVISKHIQTKTDFLNFWFYAFSTQNS